MFIVQLLLLCLLVTVVVSGLVRAWVLPAGRARTLWLRRAAIIGACVALLPVIGAARWLFFPFGMVGTCDMSARLAAIRHRQFAYDRNGRPLGPLDERVGRYVEYANLNPGVAEAFAAAEDRRIFEHDGVDARGVLRAVYRGVVNGRREGASTIHMQLVRTLCGHVMPPDHTWPGKLSELAAGVRLAAAIEPRKVLEAYVNTVYLGRNRWGLDAAARTYFGVLAEDVSVAEAAQLAALIRSPRTLDPEALGSDLARTARARVLSLAAITFKSQTMLFKEAEHEGTRLLSDDSRMRTGIADYIAAMRTVPGHMSGDSVVTGLDLGLQEAAEHVVAGLVADIERGRFGRYVADVTDRLESIYVAMDVKTGELRAYLPGRPDAPASYDRIRDGRILWSSTLKPITYGINLDAGRISPSERIRDVVARTDINLLDPWMRRIAGRCNLDRTVEQGLAYSDNCLAVAMLDLLTPADHGRLRGLGLDLPNPVSPVEELGIGAESPLTILRAYAAVANGGVLVQPRFRKADPALTTKVDTAHLWSPETAHLVGLALRCVVEQGTARTIADRLSLIPNAVGKTGTADDGTEFLFAGTSGDVAALLWVGHDLRRPIVRNADAGHVVATAWADILVRQSYGQRGIRPDQGRSAW